VHAQAECGFVDEVTPFLTNMRELAPPKPVIPTVLLIQSIAVEYVEEYVIVKPMDNRVWDVVSLLNCCTW
jgi:hypothetical protein